MVKLTKDDTTFTKWDAADYLTSERKIAAYFQEVLSDGTPYEIMRALKTCARARNRLNKTAEVAEISRTTLYRYLNGKTKPSFDKFLKIIAALGITLKVEPTK